MSIPITFGSLFAGIGGIDLGFERCGMECRWQVEIDKYANKVLEKHWPHVERWGDVRTFPPDSSSKWKVDVIAGGFPCQDISVAGKGAGLNGTRSGLFFEIIRLARQLRPRAIVLENVSALLVRGMGTVLAELAEVGFDAEWHCIPAAGVGAPHRRDRVFIIAYTQHDGSHGDGKDEQERERQEMGRGQFSGRNGSNGDVADSDGCEIRNADSNYENSFEEVSEWKNSESSGSCSRRNTREQKSLANSDSKRGCSRYTERQNAKDARQSSRCKKFRHWDVEPDVGRVANGVPARVDRLRGLGNAVVPQVAQVVGTMLLERLERQQ